MIRLDGVSKSFGAVPALCDLSFSVERHTALAVVGPSGSGKTTLLRLIAGLEEPDAGQVIIDGKVMSRPGSVAAPHTRGIGMVFQRPALWPHLTVAQHITFGLTRQGRAQTRSRLETMSRLVRLQGLETRYPHQLSGGEAQRVALARALAPEPRILLLDEPLANLDPELRSEMLRLIGQVRDETGVTLVLVSHNQVETVSICDHVLALRGGRTVPASTPNLVADAQTTGRAPLACREPPR
jgi:iron(III) transport system ATP-binding protein